MANLPNVDTAFTQAVQSKKLPGVVVAAATDKGALYEKAFGVRELGKPAPMTLDTVVWIASMTKAITATAAMQLVEKGKLSLDQPAREMVPQVGAARVIDGFDSAGKPKLREPRRPITLRQLLTHTAGYSYEIWSPTIAQYQTATDTPGITTCTNKALTTPLLFDPGDRWEYGINIDWTGKMVEAASGQKLDRYLQENIMGPLGMKDTSFKLYLAFARMIMLGGRINGTEVLKPETVATMAQNHIGPLEIGVMKTAMPGLSRDVELFPGMSKKWGLSFLINTQQAATGRSAGSLAWAGLANTYFWIDRTKRVCGVFLSQVLPFYDETAIGLFGTFETEVYRAL